MTGWKEEITMTKRLDYASVQTSFPEAWKALPEPYQNDSCLSFYLDNGDLLADHDLGGTYFWNFQSNVWETDMSLGFDLPSNDRLNPSR